MSTSIFPSAYSCESEEKLRVTVTFLLYNTNTSAWGGTKWNLRSHLKPKRKGAYGSYILYFSDNLVNKNINQLVRQRKEFKSVSFNVFTE